VTNLREYAAMPGVKDLPFKPKGFFALALKAEAEGDHERAEEYLAKAVVAEAEA